MSINCPKNDPSHEPCPPWAKTGWQAAQVGLVAVVDTLFWPSLKALFFFVHDARHSETARTVLRGASACTLAVLILSTLRMAWNHEQVRQWVMTSDDE